MFLPGCFHRDLVSLDDGEWRAILERHPFWKSQPYRIGQQVQGVAFHVLMSGGRLAVEEDSPGLQAEREFNGLRVPPDVLADPSVAAAAADWVAMHEQNCGPGFTLKMGIYVVHPGGTLGYHIDGPVVLDGETADFSSERVQNLVIATHASHRTVLPLHFNDDDGFMVCGYRVPMRRGQLFEFSNALPHAYFNRGSGHAALLVTTYLVEELVPVAPNA